MRRGLVVAVLGGVVVLLATLAVARVAGPGAPGSPAAARPGSPSGSPSSPSGRCGRVVGAWLPYWRQGPALASFVAHADAVREVTPFWYELASDPSGEPMIRPYPGAGDAAVLDAVRRTAVPLVPIVTNFGVPAAAFEAVLADPARRSGLVERLRLLAAAGDHAGLDLDFEQLWPRSRAAFTALAEETAAALHADGRRLVLSVPAKTEEPGRYSNAQAFDYPALGRTADLLRLMTYGLADGAPAGPVAPLAWTDAVAAFAARVVDPAKIELGIPLGGYDWPATGRPRSLTFAAADALRRGSGAPRQWDPATGSPFFRYGDRTVWYADAEAVRVRAAAVLRHGLAGVALWALGQEDPAVWQQGLSALRADCVGALCEPPR